MQMPHLSSRFHGDPDNSLSIPLLSLSFLCHHLANLFFLSLQLVSGTDRQGLRHGWEGGDKSDVL